MKTNQNSTGLSTHNSTQLFMRNPTQISVSESNRDSTLYVCGRCKCSLPMEAFYIDKKTGYPGSYCKECRKAISRQQRSVDKSTLVTQREAEYPLITCTTDPVERKAMILRALQTVAASIERKKKKLH